MTSTPSCQKIRPGATGYPGPEACIAVIARTDPHEQDSVVLLPDLESLLS